MKKGLLIFLSLLMLSGCSQKKEEITFQGVIEDVTSESVLVRTEELPEGDLIWVNINDIDVNFSVQEGQVLNISIGDEIAESYPLQAAATKVELVKEVQKEEVKVKTITAQEAKEIMDSEEEYTLLDVRTQTEFDAGHIPGALLISSTELKDEAVEKLPNPKAKILVYCRSGNRSAKAAQLLVDMGYTDVYDFGGIIDWPYETE